MTAMAAFCGLRPVAKAFGAGSSMTYTPGFGQAAGDAQALDEVVEPLVLGLGSGAGPAHGKGDLVGLPVRREGDRRR